MARHERHERHHPCRPVDGDGSCWITPEGYIPLEYEEHWDVLSSEGMGRYCEAYRKGWISVGIREDYVEVYFFGERAERSAIEYLRRILSPLFQIGRVRMEDRADGDCYRDQHFCERDKIQEHLAGLLSRLNAEPVERAA